MSSKKAQWELNDFSQAMANAIFQNSHHRYLKQDGDMLKFNGFWRDGDKQNVCAWLNKATWHDAKTGEGGGCKEFAKTVFNMTLPEFMQLYGNSIAPAFTFKPNNTAQKSDNALANQYLEKLWQSLCARDLKRQDHAAHWLEKIRGFNNSRSFIGSGFANLYHEDVELFSQEHHVLLKQRISLGPHLIAPIRSTKSEKVENLFFRAIPPVPKDQKSRLLTGAGGFGDGELSLRAFGFPHLINDFSQIILCEGMADYFALECLLQGEKKYLPLGVANAAALPKWAEWLVKINYPGQVILIYQLDTDPQGKIAASAIGQKNAASALKILKADRISAELFNWPSFLKRIPHLQKIPKDLAEIYSIVPQSHDLLTELFIKEITCRT